MKNPKGLSDKQLKEQLEKHSEAYNDIRKRIEVLESKLDKKVKKFEASIKDLRDELENLRFKESHKKIKIDSISSALNESKQKEVLFNPENPLFAPPVEPVIDDLTHINGLEDVHERILNMNKLLTYKQLAQMQAAELQEIFEEEGLQVTTQKIKAWLKEAHQRARLDIQK